MVFRRVIETLLYWNVNNRAGGAGDVVETPPLVQTAVEAHRGRMLNTCTSNYIRGTRCGNKHLSRLIRWVPFAFR